uniref:Uncharacterized protein n=1 Tax=Anguilla anguilla TaxID=7936 RepID=A0A0E9UH06_ANGAN
MLSPSPSLTDCPVPLVCPKAIRIWNRAELLLCES